jgi:hypothetical protein
MKIQIFFFAVYSVRSAVVDENLSSTGENTSTIQKSGKLKWDNGYRCVVINGKY